MTGKGKQELCKDPYSRQEKQKVWSDLVMIVKAMQKYGLSVVRFSPSTDKFESDWTFRMTAENHKKLCQNQGWNDSDRVQIHDCKEFGKFFVF